MPPETLDFEEPIASKSTVSRICEDTRERYRQWCRRRLEVFVPDLDNETGIPDLVHLARSMRTGTLMLCWT